MRAVVARSAADAVAPHLLSLLSVAPELARDLPVPAEIGASFAFSREGNLRDWTLRIAHGVADFLLVQCRRAPSTVLFFNLDHADPTDREFIAVLRRRADPGALSIRVCHGADSATVENAAAAARAFIASSGLSAPDGEAASLLAASDQCMRMAYYDAALEWAAHGRSMVDPAAAPEEYGKLTRNMLFALLLLGRHGEAEAISRAAQAQPADPALLAHATYAMAILNVRLYDAARRDYDAAMAWIEQSLAFTDRLPPSETRAVNHAFLMNTRALVEMRKGRDLAALELMDAALAYMAREAPAKYPLECGILLHNRARLHVAAGRTAAAIGDLTRLLEVEPSNSEAYFDRGLIQQRAGRHDAALEDYERAIRCSPPYWQPHFNRAQVLTALGRAEEAVAAYDRVLVLHPEHLETRVNRGRLHFELDHPEAAGRDAAEALSLDEGNAPALCLRGLLAIRQRDFDAAGRYLSAAIAADPQLADAWANRATVHFRTGMLDAARADIERAALLRPDTDILHNRGRILEACAARKGRRNARP